MKPKQILTFALIILAIAYFALNATKQMEKIEATLTDLRIQVGRNIGSH